MKKASKAPKLGTVGDLLDSLKTELDIETDVALAQALQVKAPVISNLRNGRLPFGDTYILRAHEATGWPVALIRSLIPAR